MSVASVHLIVCPVVSRETQNIVAIQLIYAKWISGLNFNFSLTLTTFYSHKSLRTLLFIPSVCPYFLLTILKCLLFNPPPLITHLYSPSIPLLSCYPLTHHVHMNTQAANGFWVICSRSCCANYINVRVICAYL